jgi:hypothetical protein
MPVSLSTKTNIRRHLYKFLMNGWSTMNEIKNRDIDMLPISKRLSKSFAYVSKFIRKIQTHKEETSELHRPKPDQIRCGTK